MNCLELDLLKEIESLESIKSTLTNLKANTQKTLKQLQESNITSIKEYEESLKAELTSKLDNLTEKFESDLYNLEKNHVFSLNKVDKDIENLKEDTLINYQDSIEVIEDTIAKADLLKEELQDLLGSDKYNAYMEVLDKRLDFEISLESSDDCIDLINKYSQVKEAFENLNPVNPENGLTSVIHLILKPYIHIRNLFKDKSSQRLMDLTSIVTIMYLVINYRVTSLAVISLYVTITFITNYYISSRIYSNFEDYYLITSALQSDIIDKYKKFILDECLTESDLDPSSKQEELEELLMKTKKDLRKQLELDKQAVIDSINLEEKISKFKEDCNNNLNNIFSMTNQQLENQSVMLEDGIKMQESRIKELKRKLLIMPWYEPVYPGPDMKPGTEINNISDCPEAIIGYKHNEEHNFDVVHTIPLRDTSYLVIHNNTNLEVVNDTIILNMINYFSFYKPKLAKATLIDTVSLGRLISNTNIDKEYWKVITNKDAYNECMVKLESDVATRNNLISKECRSIHEYNNLIHKRSGIMLPYHFIYIHNIQDLLSNEVIQKMSIQESIGITMVVLLNMDNLPSNKSDLLTELENFKSKFNYVIMCDDSDVKMIDNKSNNKMFKSILDY